MARKRKSGVTARQDSEARDVKDDRDSDEPIALREDAEECDEGARAADLDEHALIREELGQTRRAWEKRESDFAALMVAQQQQTEAMLHGVVNSFRASLWKGSFAERWALLRNLHAAEHDRVVLRRQARRDHLHAGERRSICPLPLPQRSSTSEESRYA